MNLLKKMISRFENYNATRYYRLTDSEVTSQKIHFLSNRSVSVITTAAHVCVSIKIDKNYITYE